MKKFAIIKRTGLGHNITATLKYIGDEGSLAHNLKELRRRYHNDPKMQKRINQYDTCRNVEVLATGNRSCNWPGAAHDFKKLSHLKPHNKVKTINIVLSPSKGTIDFHDRNQIIAFGNFCLRYVKKAFPCHMAYIGIQHDNHHMITHAHLIVSSLSVLQPYNALKGWQYDNRRLQRIYNQQRKKFNREQDFIHLGPALSEHKPKPTKTDRWLIQHSQAPLRNLKLGKDKNRTALKKDFKQHGIRFQISEHKHRKYENDSSDQPIYHMDKNGHNHRIPIYKRYQSGKKRGQFMYYKNRNGNRVKIPEYTYTAGVTMKPIHPVEKHKYDYVNGSKLARLSGDQRFNGKFILTTLYQIKKGRYTTSESIQKSSASATENSEANDQSAATRQQSLATEQNRQAVKRLTSYYAKRSQEAVQHSQAVNQQLQSAKSRYTNASQKAASYYIARRGHNHRLMDHWNHLNYNCHKHDNFIRRIGEKEAQRVTKIMKKFKMSQQNYALWYYRYAVPAKAVYYRGKIPLLDRSFRNRQLLHKLARPIIHDFRAAKVWAFDKWQSGIVAIKRFLDMSIGNFFEEPEVNFSIMDLIKSIKWFKRPKYTKQAQSYKHVWPKIKKAFFHHIINPLIRRDNRTNEHEDNVLTKHIETYQEQRSLTNAQKTAATKISHRYQSTTRSINSSDQAWQNLFAADTPLGSYAKAANEDNLSQADDQIDHREERELNLANESGHQFIRQSIRNSYRAAKRLLFKKARRRIRQIRFNRHQRNLQNLKASKHTPQNEAGDDGPEL